MQVEKSLRVRDPDPFLVKEYEQDIFEHMKALEVVMMPSPDYMDHQQEVDWEMRSKLLGWLMQVHAQFKLLPETIYIAVNLLDRFLAVKHVSVSKLQLAGVTALLIASKFEEILAPSVNDLIYMVDNAYTNQELLSAERFMLQSVHFQISFPHPINIINIISQAVQADSILRRLSQYFCQLSLLNPFFLKFRSSQLASAALFLSIKVIHDGDWVNEIHVECLTGG